MRGDGHGVRLAASGTAVVSAWLKRRLPGRVMRKPRRCNSGSGQATSASVVIQSLGSVGRCLAGEQRQHAPPANRSRSPAPAAGTASRRGARNGRRAWRRNRSAARRARSPRPAGRRARNCRRSFFIWSFGHIAWHADAGHIVRISAPAYSAIGISGHASHARPASAQARPSADARGPRRSSRHFGGAAGGRRRVDARPARRDRRLIGPNGAGKTTLFNLLAGTAEAVAPARSLLDGAADRGRPPHRRLAARPRPHLPDPAAVLRT